MKYFNYVALLFFTIFLNINIAAYNTPQKPQSFSEKTSYTMIKASSLAIGLSASIAAIKMSMTAAVAVGAFPVTHLALLGGVIILSEKAYNSAKASEENDSEKKISKLLDVTNKIKEKAARNTSKETK